MTHAPLVSVLMPAYNCASFIDAAIQSVLAQTYSQFEVLVIDDGSTDRTSEIVTTYADHDPRIRLITRDHQGLVETLNYGLGQARGSYLARLDSDDISAPHRLEVQVSYLEARSEVVIIGSAYTLIDPSGAPHQISYMPQSDVAIRWHGLFHSPFAHSSVMLRLDVLRRFGLSYDPSMHEAEDFELWSQLLQHGQGCNLPDTLVQYRQHPEQASQQGQLAVWEFAGRVAQKNLITLGASLPIDEVQKLRVWFYHFPAHFEHEDLPLAEALLSVLNRFSVQPGLDPDEVERVRGRWLGRLLRAGLFQKDAGWFLRMLGRLNYKDFSTVMAYLGERDKLI